MGFSKYMYILHEMPLFCVKITKLHWMYFMYFMCFLYNINSYTINICMFMLRQLIAFAKEEIVILVKHWKSKWMGHVDVFNI